MTSADVVPATGARLIRETLGAVRDTLGLAIAYVSRLDRDEMVYEVIEGDPSSFGAHEGTRVPLRDTYCSVVMDGHVPPMMGDVRAYPRARAMAVTDAAGIGAFCSVALRRRDGGLYGTLCATDHRVAEFDQRDLRVMRLLARLIAHQLDQDAVSHELAALGNAVAHSANAIMHISLEGVVLSWNRAAERLVGIPTEAAVGREILDLVVDEDERDGARAWLARVSAGEEVGYELARPTADGSPRWLAVTLSPVLGPEGRVLSISAVAQDITRQQSRKFHRQIERDVIAALGAAPDVAAAATETFAVINRGHELALAVLWEMDDAGTRLRLTHHHAPEETPGLADFVRRRAAHPLVRDEGLAGRVWSAREAEWCEDLDHAPAADLPATTVGLRSSIVVPVVSGGHLVAVAQFFSRDRRVRNDGHLYLAGELLARLASGIQRLQAQSEVRRNRDRLAFEVRIRTAELEAALAELEFAQADTVRRLSAAIEFRDEDTGEHIARVSRVAARLAAMAGLSQDQCELISRAAPLHDLGKVAIPDAVLLKPGALDAGERSIMQTHAQIGYELLDGSPSPLLQTAALIALTHHERWDGRGYPRGLRGAEIPIEGRVVAIADVFDALTSDRVYRAAMSQAEALQVMADGRGTQFDPDLIGLFLRSGLAQTVR